MSKSVQKKFNISDKNHTIIELYFSDRKFTGKSDTYQKIAKNYIQEFLSNISKDLDLISSSDVFAWLDKYYLDNSYNGVDGPFLVLSDLFDYCVKNQWMMHSPLNNIITIGLVKGYAFFKPFKP